MKNNKLFLIIGLLSGLFCGCNKFLEEKSDKKLVIPTVLADLQAMLDNSGLMNVSDPGEGEVSADDYYLPESSWASLSNEYDRRAYIWRSDYTTTHTSWFTAYRYVYYANIVLESLDQLSSERHDSEWRNLAGQAYFTRARGHLSIQLIWALAYDDQTADTDMGIPLRLSSDFNRVSSRPTNRETYEQIVEDLEKAIALLPIAPEHVLRASKPAAYALMARTYLFMREYDKCLAYADSCLRMNNSLLDYNNLDTSSNFPVPQFNAEVLFHSSIRSAQPIQPTRALVDSNLYALYDNDDLRKAIFFRDNGDNTHTFKGSYASSQTLFAGLGVDEVYLIRAEGHVRQGNVSSAMADLNHLLAHRYRKGTFAPFEITDAKDALELILLERRKELLFRGLRFPDVKRLNKEGAEITLRRYFAEEDTTYLLPSNDLRFAISIPETVIERAPAILPNPR